MRLRVVAALGLVCLAACNKSPAPTPAAKKGPPVVANDPGADSSPFDETPATPITPGKPVALECATPKQGQKDHCVDLVIDAPAEVAVGAQAKVSVALKAIKPYHLNVLRDEKLDLDPPPWFVQLKETPGVTAKPARKELAEATRKALEETAFDLTFVAKEAGSKEMHAAVQYAACAESFCVPGVVHLVWQVAVK